MMALFASNDDNAETLSHKKFIRKSLWQSQHPWIFGDSLILTVTDLDDDFDIIFR